jgi:hypothetical protein
MKISKLTLGLLTLFAGLILSSCKKSDTLPPSPSQTIAAPSADEFQSPAFQADNLDQLENPAITDGIQADFQVTAQSDNDPISAPYTQNGKDNLPTILKQLNLDSSQKGAIKGYFADYRDCIKEHVRKVIEIHQEILKKYNGLRRQAFEAYKAGKITKEQYEKRLHELHDKLTYELKSHPLKLEELKIARRCREQLTKEIASVLNKDQLARFRHWLETHK